MSKSITTNTIHTSLVLGVRALVQAGTLLLVARLLMPEQFGTFVGISALAVLLGTLSTFGTHWVLLGDMSKNVELRNEILAFAIPTTLIAGGLLLIAYLCLCALFFNDGRATAVFILLIGLTEIILQPLITLKVSEHLAREETAQSQLLQSTPLALRLAAALAIMAWQPTDTLSAYSGGYFLASAITLLAMLITMRIPWPPPQRWRLATRKELKHSGKYGALAVTSMAPAELDKALATSLLSLPAAGLYAAGSRIIGAVTMPVTALLFSALPRLFREGESQSQRTEQLFGRIIGLTAIYGFVLAALIFLCAPVFTWLMGNQYDGVSEVIGWICLAIPGLVLRISTGNLLITLGAPLWRASIETLGIIILISTAVLLTSSFGHIGMPLALAFSEWSMAISGFMLIMKTRHKSFQKKMR